MNYGYVIKLLNNILYKLFIVSQPYIFGMFFS